MTISSLLEDWGNPEPSDLSDALKQAVAEGKPVRDYVTDIMTRKHKKSVRGKGGKKIRPKEKEA